MQSMDQRMKGVAAVALACALGAGAGLSGMLVSAAPASTEAAATSAAAGAAAEVPNEPRSEPGSKHKLDRSGRAQTGKASFYAARYSGRTMADGTPMRLYSNNAASLTLPLGTVAKVTNLETGKSAVVTIRDRGPYVDGRIVDLSPATARQIGISTRQGLANVEVKPISLPPA